MLTWNDKFDRLRHIVHQKLKSHLESDDQQPTPRSCQCKWQYSTYNWKKVGVEGWSPTLPEVLRDSFVLCFIDRHALLTGSFYIIVWTHPAKPSCPCPAYPRLPTRHFWKWWSRNTGTTRIFDGWRRLLERGKDGQSNGKLSTFLRRDIALFIFGACLQSKRSRGWDLQPRENHLQCTARNMDGVEQKMVFLDRCWDIDIPESLYDI